ncbi:tyrosine-type recombinase/integrase [Patescibacteria group bacterium]|nr:tyrosine-type recombinase/integrase [Patescibacteria group bacterium]
MLPSKDDFLLNLLNNNYSNETIYNYERDLSLFELFLKDSNLSFSKVDKKNIVLYKDFLRKGRYFELLKNDHQSIHNFPKDSEGKLDSRSINRMLSSLRSYLKYLIDFDIKTPISPEMVKLIKTVRKESQVADKDDLIRLIESPTLFEKDIFIQLRNRAILETLFSTGMRISELVSLNRDQINDDGKIYVLGKGKKQRFVYLTDRSKQHIFDYLNMREDDYPALFIPRRGGRNGSVGHRISTNYIQYKIAIYRRKLGIIVPTSAHSLRHGFATYLVEEGANPSAIQILLGHESLQTTNKYVHASDRYAEETHRKFHPLKD